MFDPVPGMDDLLAALNTFNAVQLARLEAVAGLRHLGAAGPVYLAGHVRIRGAFVDPAGAHWADARLVVESAYLKTSAWPYWSNEIAGQLDPAHDVWIADRHRGLVDAVIAPIPTIAKVLDLPTPEPFPDGWCRDWTTLPTVTDDSMLTLVATGWDEPPTNGRTPS
jgi:hypothetical protein